MQVEKNHKVHPIIKEALEIAHVGVEPVEFDEDAIEELKHSLSNWFGHPDLMTAVVDLINFAWLLQEQGARTASLDIICVVSTAAEALQELTKNSVESKPEDSV